jgi:SAM-dependent methyltransferase
MRILELDRDMSDVIPTGATRDSLFLFRRMEEETIGALGPPEGSRFLDVAAGVGQDGRGVAGRGAGAVGAAPSKRMTQLALLAGEKAGPREGPVRWVRAWSESLPFRAGSFDAAFCKGALDHFDDPVACIEESARVTRSDGRVVFAVANFESLACRLSRAVDRIGRLAGRRPRGRRASDVPSDHFTRYDPDLLRAQLEGHLVVESWTGISLFWGVRTWGRLLGVLPSPLARLLLSATDQVARLVPAWSDVIVAAGRPRPESSPTPPVA